MSVMLRLARAALAFSALVGCGRPLGSIDAPPPDLHALVPDVELLAGWGSAADPREFAPETLYEYLDGGAERYLSYGFRRLLQVRYEPVGEQQAGITLDVYDMGDDLGAFGIYSSLRPDQPDVRAWGVEGYRSGAVAAAWKGAVFTHAEADDEVPENGPILEAIVAAVCASITGPAEAPWILDPLPEEGLVSGSQRYVATDLLGHAFLPGGVLATYESDGDREEVFFSDLGSPQDAAAALSLLRAHFREWGEVTGEEDGSGFGFVAPGLGTGTAFAVGRFVAGATGGQQSKLRKRLLDRLADGLRGTQGQPE